MMIKQNIKLWTLYVPGWLLVFYLIYAQGISAFSYELGVSMGTQEPAARITEVGTKFWWGFAFADLIIYIPLLIAGLIGYAMKAKWGELILSAALGISIYWPVVSLATVYSAHGLENWVLKDENAYWIVLPLISIWATLSLWQVLKEINNHSLK